MDLDLGDAPEQARSLVAGRVFQEAILNLAMLAASSSIVQLLEHVEYSREHAPISSRITRKIVNAAGRVVAERPPLTSEDPEERAAAERLEMFRIAGLQRVQIVLGVVEPARAQINEEHGAQADWTWLTTDNPFIPEGRGVIYSMGLQAGLSGDFLVATHLLIPQLENSLRYILVQLGEIASGIDDNLIQDEFLLDRVLRHERLTGVLNEDTIFDLKSLLIERSGGNVRNLMAHGLLDAQHFESSDMRYAWWLILRLCCLGHLYVQSSSEIE